jgi:spore coat polysaccharide biosynthesis protein SpsF
MESVDKKAKKARVMAIVQARCTSQRLPGKVMVRLGNDPVIVHVLRAIRGASRVHEVVLATTTNAADDILVEVAGKVGVRVFRGDEHDVLGRFVGAMDGSSAEVILRHTADDPLLDPSVIDTVVADFLRGGCDYGSNILERSWPRGLDTEAVSRDALLRMHREARDKDYREHVTLFARTHPDQYRLRNVSAPPGECWPELRLCIDTDEDRSLLEKIFENLYVPGRILKIGEVLTWLRANPDVARINSAVRQREVLGRVF